MITSLLKTPKPATTPVKKNSANKTGVKLSKLAKPGKAKLILPPPSKTLQALFNRAEIALGKAGATYHEANIKAIEGFVMAGGAVTASAAVILKWVLQIETNPTDGQRTAMARALKEMRDEAGVTPKARGASGGRQASKDDNEESDDEESDTFSPEKPAPTIKRQTIEMLPVDELIKQVLFLPLADQRKVAAALAEALRADEIGKRIKELITAKA